MSLFETKAVALNVEDRVDMLAVAPRDERIIQYTHNELRGFRIHGVSNGGNIPCFANSVQSSPLQFSVQCRKGHVTGCKA